MHAFHSLIFRAALHFSDTTAAVVFLSGLLLLLQGFRFARILLALSAAFGGFFLGEVLAVAAELPSPGTAALAGVLVLALCIAKPRAGIVLASAMTFAVLGFYFTDRFGAPRAIQFGVTIVAGLIGFFLYWIHRESTPVLVTSIQGAILLILGFVGLANVLLPSLAHTFVDWSTHVGLIVPGMMIILSITGYAVQSNLTQGDVTSGTRYRWSNAV